MLFDANFYAASNPDLGAAGLDLAEELLAHYVGSGLDEGRNASPIFSPNVYLFIYNDLREAGFDARQALQHFSTTGLNEGRVGSENFEVLPYLQFNADLQAAGFDGTAAAQHYRFSGIGEGRIGFGSASGTANLGDAINPPRALTLSGTVVSTVVRPLFGNTNVLGSGGDTNDTYRFDLDEPTRIRLSVPQDDPGNGEFARTALYRDLNGNDIFDEPDLESVAFISGTSGIDLNPETYFFDVFVVRNFGTTNIPDSSLIPGDGLPIPYALEIATAESIILAQEPGSDLPAAANLGVADDTARIVDMSLNFPGDIDTFQFVLERDNRLFLSSFNASLELIQDTNDNNAIDVGEVLATAEIVTSSGSGDPQQTALPIDLTAGTYFARITEPVEPATRPFGGSSYLLELTAISTDTIAALAANDGGGNDAANATAIDPLTGFAASDYVGSADAADVYRFELASDRTVDVSLGFRSDVFTTFTTRVLLRAPSLDSVSLSLDSNGNGAIEAEEQVASFSASGLNATDAQTLNLAAGTYFLNVLAPQDNRLGEAPYELSVSIA